MLHAGSRLRHAVSLVTVRGLLSSCGVQVFSSCGAQAPGRVGSVAVVRGLSCPTACGILVPWPGTEPPSSALEDGFFTTGPPGKSHKLFL